MKIKIIFLFCAINFVAIKSANKAEFCSLAIPVLNFATQFALTEFAIGCYKVVKSYVDVPRSHRELLKIQESRAAGLAYMANGALYTTFALSMYALCQDPNKIER